MRNFVKKITTFAMAAVLSLTAGCTAQETADSQNAIPQEETAAQSASDTILADNRNETETAGMGRYVEHTILETEFYSNEPLRLKKMADGKIAFLYMADDQCSVYESADGGETWESGERGWMQEYMDSTYYTFASAMAPDGMVALCYTPPLEENNGEFDPHYVLLPADAAAFSGDGVISFDLELSEAGNFVRSFTFDDVTGRLFTTSEGKIYEISVEDGSSKELVSVESSVTYLESKNGLLLCATGDGIQLYDTEAGTFVEDKVLQDFITETYGGITNYNTSTYNAYAFLDADSSGEQVIYIAGAKGMHRHVIGGSAVEQVVDGSLSSLGNPSNEIASAMILENQEFLVLYGTGTLVKLTYDPNISTVPENLIRVYSLNDNDTIRQAVSAYQTQYPEMYVEYEVGMEGNGVSREDALKKLSTQLLDGSGPDVLILDNLPMDSYISKGILMDISDTVRQANEESSMFMNLFDPLYQGENLYAVPAEFKLPVLSGREEVIKDVENLEGIADMFEAIRKEQPEGMVIYKCAEIDIMQTFAEVCGPAWKTADGNINKEAVRDFLVQLKRISDVQMGGIPEKIATMYSHWSVEVESELSMPFRKYKYFYMMYESGYLSGMTQLMCGDVDDSGTYNALNSVKKTEGFSDTAWKPMPGQSSNVYVPLTMAGINASSKSIDAAKTFIQVLLGTQVQENTFCGLPVNKAAFEQVFVVDENLIGEDGAYAWLSTSTIDGMDLSYRYYVPTEEELSRLRDWIAQSDTPYICDIVIEDAVLEEGEKYLKGEADLDTAVDKIMDRVQIYLAE